MWGIEPPPNIRDGILVESLVKTMRYFEKCERTNGRCRKSGKRSSQEISQHKISRWIQQECKSRVGASAGNSRD
jgi:hypothetical protein